MSYRGVGPLNPWTRILVDLGKWHIYSEHLYGGRLVVTQHFCKVLSPRCVIACLACAVSASSARAYSASVMIWDVYQWFRLGRIHPVLLWYSSPRLLGLDHHYTLLIEHRYDRCIITHDFIEIKQFQLIYMWKQRSRHHFTFSVSPELTSPLVWCGIV